MTFLQSRYHIYSDHGTRDPWTKPWCALSQLSDVVSATSLQESIFETPLLFEGHWPCFVYINCAGELGEGCIMSLYNIDFASK